jgi:hypothetical protein
MSEEFDWGHWSCNHADSIPEGTIGFVYKITEKSSNKFYIGCKLVVNKLTRPPLKGKKRKRRSLVESDWKTYCSSSGAISESVSENKSNFTFEILSFHPSKSSLKIEEARLIINDIYNPMCYNEVVNLRCRASKRNINIEKGNEDE